MSIRPRITRRPDGFWVAIGSVPFDQNSIAVVKEIIDERPFRMEAERRIGHHIAAKRALNRMRPRLPVPSVSFDGSVHSPPNAGAFMSGVPLADVAGIPVAAGFGISPEALDWSVARLRQLSDILTSRDVRAALLDRLGRRVRTIADVADQYRKQQGLAAVAGGVAGTTLLHGGMPTGRSPVMPTYGVVAGAMGGFAPDQKLHTAVGRRVALLEARDPATCALVVQIGRTLGTDPRAAKFLRELIEHATCGPAGSVLYEVFKANGLLKLATVTAKQREHHLRHGGAR